MSSGYNAEPNVVPLTDILLVLLIIFMVITPMLKKGVDVKLPEAGNVITIEPGLYYPDIGGVRVEDTVVVTKQGWRHLAATPTGLTP